MDRLYDALPYAPSNWALAKMRTLSEAGMRNDEVGRCFAISAREAAEFIRVAKRLELTMASVGE